MCRCPCGPWCFRLDVSPVPGFGCACPLPISCEQVPGGFWLAAVEALFFQDVSHLFFDCIFTQFPTCHVFVSRITLMSSPSTCAVCVPVWCPEQNETMYFEETFFSYVSDAFLLRLMECHGDGHGAFSRVPCWALCFFFGKSNICSNQLDLHTSVSHNSTESETISLDASLRVERLLALDSWDLVIEVLGTTQRVPKPTQACTRETGAALQSTPKIEQVLDQT